MCNVLYRIISCLLAAWLRPILPRLVGSSQCAFAPSTAITDAILTVHEIVSCFHVSRGQSKMLCKVDLSKVYDSLN